MMERWRFLDRLDQILAFHKAGEVLIYFVI